MSGNVENLRKAALAKRTAAIARAEKGLRGALRDGEPITFENIAARSGVSKDFLYRNQPLRRRIEQLRTQQAINLPDRLSPAQSDPILEDSNSVIRTLTTKLIEEKHRHRREVASLREELAAAHGQILLLSRKLNSTSVKDIDPDPPSPGDRAP